MDQSCFRVVPEVVEVCRKSNGEVLARVKRVIWGESIGNFNPFFCRYKNKKYLVHSRLGDLSDPFRREDAYKDHLFIEVE